MLQDFLFCITLVDSLEYSWFLSCSAPSSRAMFMSKRLSFWLPLQAAQHQLQSYSCLLTPVAPQGKAAVSAPHLPLRCTHTLFAITGDVVQEKSIPVKYHIKWTISYMHPHLILSWFISIDTAQMSFFHKKKPSFLLSLFTVNLSVEIDIMYKVVITTLRNS